MSKYRKNELTVLAAMFKALSNEHRLRIYLQLLDCCPTSDAARCSEDAYAACVGDLGRDIDLAPSTVSHHIKELKQSGLIRIERRGRFMHCAAEPRSAERLRAALAIPPGGPRRKMRSTACRA